MDMKQPTDTDLPAGYGASPTVGSASQNGGDDEPVTAKTESPQCADEVSSNGKAF